MGRYTETCGRCGCVYAKGAIHFGDTCDRQKAKREAGELTGLQAEIAALRTELAEWRSGKRRVFWRVKWRHLFAGGHMTQDWGNRIEAKQHATVSHEGRVYRVTVGPAKKKEAV